jgi:sorbitol-specific phosphotransferase system component IIC
MFKVVGKLFLGLATAAIGAVIMLMGAENAMGSAAVIGDSVMSRFSKADPEEDDSVESDDTDSAE